MADSTGNKLAPPYVAYGTFRNFIESLSKTTTPKYIDKSMMPTYSGATQNHLIAALRSMQLIKTDGEATGSLQGLVSAIGNDTWPKVLGNQIQAVYAPILGTLNIAHATPKQLRDRFKDAGNVDGEVGERCIRFYLSALKDAKLAVSPHLLARRPRGTNPKRAVQSAATPPAATETPPPRGSDPGVGKPPDLSNQNPALKEFPVYFKGKPTGKILVPENIGPEDVQMFDLTLALVKAYANQGKIGDA